VYRDDIYPVLLFGFMSFSLYVVYVALIKEGYYGAYAPIVVTNMTEGPLTIFIDGRRIGVANPGKRRRNNRALKSRDKYLVEAKDANGNAVLSKEFQSAELDELGWKIVVGTREEDSRG
jgi:hypothetical protein